MTAKQLPFASGVDVHRGKIRLRFTYKGERCSEILHHVTSVDAASVKYANRKIATIRTEIAEDRFDYVAHFPKSKTAARFSGVDLDLRARTVAEGVKTWLEIQKLKRATSTFNGYASKAKRVTREWPDKKIADLTKTDIERFQTEMITRDNLDPKTVNDVFTVVRGVWADAYSDGVIDSNPLSRIDNLSRDFESQADPLSRAEIDRLVEFRDKYHRPQDVDALLFDIWSGYSVSELHALAWEDIDLETWEVEIRRARVEAEYKVPKEPSRARKFRALVPAREILKSQRARTYMLPARDVEVVQRNNMTKRTETLRFVFMNEQPGGPIPWAKKAWADRVADILRRAKLKHRGPNQARHTFASQLLSNYVPDTEVARFMGHTGPDMVRRNYGKFIPEDAPDRSDEISSRLGFKTENSNPDIREEVKR